MPTDRVVLSVYVSRDDVDLLRARAADNDRSVSAEVRRLLRPLHNAPQTREAPAATPEPHNAHGEVREHAGTV